MKRLVKFLKSRWFQHPVFWMLSIYAIGSYFAISSILKFLDFYYALFFHIPLFFLVYVNLLVIVPKLLKKGRYALYALSVLALLAATYWLHEFTFEVIVAETALYMVSFADWQVLVTIFAIYIVLTTLLTLSKSWYTLQQVEKEKLSIELDSLKTQVNPHFLFNSLNSIYSLALAKSEQTADSVLELSNLLRYMLYEVGEDKVPLEKEVEMIENYIELQKLRADASTKVQFSVSGKIEAYKVAPLLFFPLIENAFKHGVKGVSEEGFIHIEMKLDKGLYFEISNNKGVVDDMEQGKYGGIGLENVKRRLELIYTNAHSFEIEETADLFTAKLTLK